MSEREHDRLPEEESSGYTPAPFEKRVAAWVGVIYMVMLTLSVTYMIATAQVLTGTAFLLLPPAAVGVAVIAIHHYRQGDRKLAVTVAVTVLCAAVFLLGLAYGIPTLLAQLGVG